MTTEEQMELTSISKRLSYLEEEFRRQDIQLAVLRAASESNSPDPLQQIPHIAKRQYTPEDYDRIALEKSHLLMRGDVEAWSQARSMLPEQLEQAKTSTGKSLKGRIFYTNKRMQYVDETGKSYKTMPGN
jgi:hypothetical protein